MQWAQQQRLRFIEERLYLDGRINRSDIVEAYGVSIVQASKDLRDYRALLPENSIYDGKRKTYLAAPQFTPGLTSPCADQLLNEMATAGTSAEVMPLPGRTVASGVFRFVARAVAASVPIQITYQSLSRPHPMDRVIRPHTFVNDGSRWHVRGYCATALDFRDFLLARILNTEPTPPADIPGIEADRYWNTSIAVVLAPHPGLTPDQQKVIACDYGMTDGTISVELRQAYLPYFLRRMGLIAELGTAREQQLTVVNREDIDRWHRDIMPG